MAIADASGADLDAPKMKPGGEIQAQLRRFTAKEIISNPKRFLVALLKKRFAQSASPCSLGDRFVVKCFSATIK